ncbi:Molybdopterin oxidoreductase [Labilithrix luteola]|uniref:Molybdopterin oxidoreductase n=1 Tax=Labilithrix luteola TaxID=1391654 RepID=A0A0K1PVF8_9BACT|nr:NrfD/PsrC family molybdoenzyme membrane anchor subunit [Labilithrix luteola]AKU97515.1 Molybdopterin oxidoreductase [Labilithrix luteola]
MTATPLATTRDEELPVFEERKALAPLTDQLLATVLEPPRLMRHALIITGLVSFFLLGGAIAYTVTTGIGVWGNNIPVGWAFDITNFVWWIGIGHAGTFISAFLLLLEQKWRASINRFAEAMTLFAVMQAGLFPLLHLGRPWFFYWLAPYPSTMTVWPQFRSALTWDVVAVSTYFTVSLLFWYLGLIPDLATLRDRAPELWRRRVYAVFALGWSGSARNWNRWRIGYGLLAGLATPLVVSVHSIVSSDFAISMLPGWHSTIFPPYFVAGAIYSGFAMVVTLMIPARRIYRLERVITSRHLDAIGKMLLTTGWMVFYSYIVETFIAWYSGDRYDQYTFLVARPVGTYAAVYWTVIACNCLAPQFLWIKRLRLSPLGLWLLSLAIQLGMWAERLMLIITSESRDFLPSSWHDYWPTVVEAALLFGTMAFFLFLFLLLLRFVPFIPISEIKSLQHELDTEERARG